MTKRSVIVLGFVLSVICCASAALCAPLAGSTADADSVMVPNGKHAADHQESYASHARLRRYNRECENALAEAEVWASIASLYGVPYPAEDFASSWRRTHLNQSDGILRGTVRSDSYEHAKQLRDEVLAQTGAATDSALDAVAARIDTRGTGIPIVVFNSLAWTRTDFVTVISPFAGQSGAVRITDASGKVCAGRSLGNQLTFTARDVPAAGYRVFWVNRVPKPFGSNVSAVGSTAENQYFRVRIDPNTGVIASIYDKVNRRNILAPGQTTGLLQVMLEEFDPSSVGKTASYKSKKTLLDSSELVRIDTGPAKVTMQYDHKYGRSVFTQELTLYDAVPRIDIRLAVDWREPCGGGGATPVLKFAFPFALKSPRATFDIPFGSIRLAADGREAVGQKWADLSDAHYGVSILNDFKCGFDVAGGTLRASLLKSPREADARADMGIHEMVISLYPHAGDWRSAGTVRRGHELNTPLKGYVTTPHEGELPRSTSFVSVSSPGLVVTAIKKADDGNGFIVKLYETAGKSCKAFVRTAIPASSYVEADLMEKPIGVLRPLTGGVFPIEVGKYEIKTFRILR